MKILHLMAACGFVIAAAGIGTAAQAQYDRHNGHHNNGWHGNSHGHGAQHQRCRIEWHHRHKVRRCS